MYVGCAAGQPADCCSRREDDAISDKYAAQRTVSPSPLFPSPWVLYTDKRRSAVVNLWSLVTLRPALYDVRARAAPHQRGCGANDRPTDRSVDSCVTGTPSAWPRPLDELRSWQGCHTCAVRWLTSSPPCMHFTADLIVMARCGRLVRQNSHPKQLHYVDYSHVTVGFCLQLPLNSLLRCCWLSVWGDQPIEPTFR